jgi:hypothetical protein
MRPFAQLAPYTRATRVLEVQNPDSVSHLELSIVLAPEFSNDPGYLVGWYEADWRWFLELTLQGLQV